jgi:hypothetical protein
MKLSTLLEALNESAEIGSVTSIEDYMKSVVISALDKAQREIHGETVKTQSLGIEAAKAEIVVKKIKRLLQTI